MLLWFVDCLAGALGARGLSSLEKITLRAPLGAVVSFAVALVAGPWIIRWLKARFREPIKSDSGELRRLHQSKSSTPTMGGLFIVAGLAAGLVLLGDLANRFVQLALLVLLGMAAVGAVDDLAKLGFLARSGRARNGISVRAKLLGQLVVATLAAWLLERHLTAVCGEVTLYVPVVAWQWPPGGWFVPLAVLVMVGSANAVNLTDGLDGLAGGCLILAGGALAVAAYAAGHVGVARYLGVPHVAGGGEMVVACGCLAGAMLGFLWFNCFPAQVFMGDTGSLPLGGLLGLVALVARQELLLVIVGGVFVAETLSVLAQVGYYKWTGRRLLLCAPLHHHFQFRGWPESKIVVRFWIAAALCAVAGVACLKLHVRDDPVRPAASLAAEHPAPRR